ncbi:MLP-like protein 28 isoform X2 [Neltuma alba]|uniref:MLP-like protein 28 isoform X2 n=1 Tax=Neltuma alba TaxID=207710 RepID=UPI0010A3F5C3|nr:MLP-like protein 28 isoform X2 [Prosopis alba]
MSHLGKTEIDVHLNASAQKFHEMFTSNPHHIANISSAKIKSVTKLQGDFAKAGSIVVWNYVLDGKEGVAKDVIEAVDSAKNLIILRVIEGDFLKHYKSFKFIIQVSPKAKGSVAHWTLEYEKLHGRIPDPHSLMQLVTEMSREIDASLTQGQGQEEKLLGKAGVDVHINASADKFHEMFSSKPHHIPNVSPARIRDAILEGSWGKVGSVITWHYVHEGKNRVAKEKIHAVDASKNPITFRVVEGDILKDFKSMDITLQATPKDKGSLEHVTMEYEKLKGHIPDPHTLTKFATDVVRDVGSHLAL